MKFACVILGFDSPFEPVSGKQNEEINTGKARGPSHFQHLIMDKIVSPAVHEILTLEYTYPTWS